MHKVIERLESWLINMNLTVIFKAIALVVAITIALEFLVVIVGPFDVTHNGSVFYLIAVIVAAIRWGMIPALFAAIGGAAAAAFFFYEPIYSFSVSDPAEVTDLIHFSLVAIVTSYLASRFKLQFDLTKRREKELSDLNLFSSKLALAKTESDIYEAIQEYAFAVFRHPVSLFSAATKVDAQVGTTTLVSEYVKQKVAVIAELENTELSSTVILDNVSEKAWLVQKISADTISDCRVLVIDLGHVSQEAAEAIKVDIDQEIKALLANLERLNISRAISDAQNRLVTIQLKDALIESVSHELRSPLASIMGASSILLEMSKNMNDEQLSSMATIVRDEAERLNGDIQDLLDASRIAGRGLQAHYDWVDPADIVYVAIERKRKILSSHCLQIDLATDLPFISVDETLVAQALGQVLDNAAKYSSPGSKIQVTARGDGNELILSVSDEGIGLTSDDKNRLYERFFRGQRQVSVTLGSGLGMWIAHAFVAATGGKIAAESPGVGRGTTVSITLPVSHVAETMDKEIE